MSVSQDVNNKGTHQVGYTKSSSKNLDGKKGKKKKMDWKKQMRRWNKECGCLNGTKILTQNKLPIKCACISRAYDKEWAPGGGGMDTMVTNTFHVIKVLDLNEADKTISSSIKAYSDWEEGRINTKFPNKESKILITRVSPKHRSFSIWAPTRSLNGEISKAEWTFYFLNSFSDDETIVEGRLSATIKSPCNLDFTDFPFDKNECDVNITSKLSGELREILVQQKTKNEYFSHNAADGLDIFITLLGKTINDTDTITNDFGFRIEIKRMISSYVIQYYLPCASIVAVSSISFIIPLTAIPGRVSLVVTLFLTLSNLIIQNEVNVSTMQNEKQVGKIFSKVFT